MTQKPKSIREMAKSAHFALSQLGASNLDSSSPMLAIVRRLRQQTEDFERISEFTAQNAAALNPLLAEIERLKQQAEYHRKIIEQATGSASYSKTISEATGALHLLAETNRLLIAKLDPYKR